MITVVMANEIISGSEIEMPMILTLLEEYFVDRIL